MRTLAERLTWARTQKHLSQEALARLSGVSQSTIGNLESGLRLSARRITNIAEALGVSAIWLAEGVGSPTSTEAAEVRTVSGKRKVAIKKVELRLQAGVTGFVTEDGHGNDDTFDLDEDWVQTKGLIPERLLAIRVKGESMVPALYDGDTVVVNTLDTAPKDGVVFAVNYEGEAVIKRLVRDAGNWWLASDNADQRRYHRKVCHGDSCILIGRIVKREGDFI